MKYSNWFGIIFCAVLALACFNTWIYIVSQNISFTGMNKALPAYGRPGLLHLIFAFSAAFCFLIPKVWAKKANVFICAINLGWALRNLFIITACNYGECPERSPWMLVALSASILMLIFSFLPDIKVKNKDDF
ncbi:MAG TPA: hypothetical protein VFN30_12350 [Chitinophagaceae bacterium]|nr:hypothetical protein [Chitinophagaceae bacterium]